MKEAEIIHALDQNCQGLNLIFQVIHEDQILYVYLNRPEGQSLQYETLTVTLQRTIAALQIPHLQDLCLYSRELGTVDPDWETHIVLSSPEADLPETSVDNSSAVVDIAQPEQPESQTLESASDKDSTDLSQYCFTRNRLLLTSDILPPSESIARLLQAFDALPYLNQKQILPHLEGFFRTSNLPSIADLSADTQAWFHQLEAINPAELRKTSIWMSRYCLNSAAAMSQVQLILPNVMVAPSIVNPLPSSAQTPLTNADSSFQLHAAPTSARLRSADEQMLTQHTIPNSSTRAQKRPRFFWQVLLVPLIWLLFTATAVTYSVQSQSDPQVAAKLCKTAKGPYCQLAVQLTGPTFMEDFLELSASAMTGDVIQQGSANCAQAASVNAGFTLQGTLGNNSKPTNPIIQSEQVFPGLLVVDIQQPDKNGAMVRTACAYEQTLDPVMEKEHPIKIAAAVIPTQWPTQPFKNKTFTATLGTAMNVQGVLSTFGTNTLFTAIGIFAAVSFGLGIHINSFETLYKSAFFLGLSETIIGLIPMFGLIRFTLLEVLALMLTSAVVKDLEIDWSSGYWLVACGALAIVAIRAVLNLLLFMSIIYWLA
jgi:hypothetical protein